MEISLHAETRMLERGFSKKDVEQAISDPGKRIYEPKVRDRREHRSTTRDGRNINVITNQAETVVISVVEE